jgi:DNA-binding transcriptional regulator YdaS (Cro superfamily)
MLGMNELNRYCTDRDVILALCERLDGVSESSVYRWLRGACKPSQRMRKAIARATDGAVPVESWTKKGRKR